MYRNKSRGLKRALSTAPSEENIREAPNLNEDVQRADRGEPSQISKSQRKSTQSKLHIKETKEKENRDAAKETIRETQASCSQKKRKLDLPQNRTKKTAPSFALNDQSDLDRDLELTVFPSKFEECVAKSGCKLRSGSQKHLMKKSQVTFVKNLTMLLTENEDIVDQFMEGLEKFMEDDDNNLYKLLLETEVDSSAGEGLGMTQDSVVRMLLAVECIQTRVIALLLSKLADFIHRDSGRSKPDNRPWVLLIVKKLCFLDQVIDGQSLQKDLFRLLEVAPLSAKQEIIYNLPYILGEKQDEELASCLINLMKSKKELTPVVLEALGHLPLGTEQTKDIQNKLLQTLKNSPVEYLPGICKFLLFNQNLILSDADEIIKGVRSGLPFTKAGIKFLLKDGQPNAHKSQRPAGSSQASSVALREEIASSKTITFHNLRQAIVSNPKLLTTWYKNIKSVESVYHHRPIDIVMLLLMATKQGPHRKQIEQVWKNRISTGMFTNALLEETFEVLPEVLKKHLDTLIDVAAFLLRSPDSALSHFGMEMYKLAFLKFDPHLRRRVMMDLVTHVSSKDSYSKAALEVMHELCNSHLDLMMDLAVCLQNLLEKIYDLDLNGVRRILDFLCLLAYPPAATNTSSSTANLQDCINIMIRKYLYSHQRQMKHRGVVAAVMSTKHLAACPDDANGSLANISIASSDTSHSVSSLTPGKARDALQLFNSIVRCTSSVPEELGYSMDEMSLMAMRTTSFDHVFLRYLLEIVETRFMNSYLDDDTDQSAMSKSSQSEGEDVPLTVQYWLDQEIVSDQEESTSPVCLGIGTLVFKEARHVNRGSTSAQGNSDDWPIAVLCPVFRFLRLLQIRGGDAELKTLDAILGCQVNMPAPEVYNKFEDYSPSQQGDILDCLFHCVNWFREVVNAFVLSDAYRRKVLIRLRNMVALQQLICRLSRHVVGYTPPVANFHGKAVTVSLKPPAAKKKRKLKKKGKKKSKKAEDESIVDDPSEHEESSDKEDEEKSDSEAPVGEVNINLYRSFFREFDMNVFKIISSDLVLLPSPEKGAQTSPEFSPMELRLLLEDLVTKLSHALGSGAKRFRGRPSAGGDGDGIAGFCVLDLSPAAEVAANAVELLPMLCDKLETLNEACARLLEANDGMLDGPTMFTDPVKDIKVCFGLLFEAITLTLAWSGFQQSQNSALLTTAVKALGTRVDASSGRRTTLVPLLEESCSYLRNYTKVILDLKSAANFVRLLHVLSDHWERYFKRLPAAQQRKNPASEVLHEVTKAFLQQKWSNLNGAPEQGSAYNNQIETLLDVYMTEAPEKIRLIKSLTPELSEECMSLTGKDKDSSLKTFPVITRSNLHTLVQVLLKGTVEGTNARLADESLSDAEKIKIWEDTFKIMQHIVKIVRLHPTTRHQKYQLKWSGDLLRTFLAKGMPVMESHLKTDQDEVLAILRSSQDVTRFNHKICSTCKMRNDSALMSYVPRIKHIMESFVYRVKSMLALHGAQGAWWMGNLKNKDIADNVLEAEDDDSSSTTKPSTSSGTKNKKTKKTTATTKKKTSKKRKASESSVEQDSGKESESEKEQAESEDSDETSVSVAY